MHDYNHLIGGIFQTDYAEKYFPPPAIQNYKIKNEKSK